MAIPQRPRQNNEPLTPYKVVGLIKGMKNLQVNQQVKTEILVSILLKYINSPDITAEVWKLGFDFISNDLRASIGQPPGAGIIPVTE